MVVYPTPGQVWDRESIPGAPRRPVEVVNVLLNQVELRFLDMANAPELQRVFSTGVEQMLSPRGRGAKYRFIRNG
jgi:hypothetical protein